MRLLTACLLLALVALAAAADPDKSTKQKRPGLFRTISRAVGLGDLGMKSRAELEAEKERALPQQEKKKEEKKEKKEDRGLTLKRRETKKRVHAPLGDDTFQAPQVAVPKPIFERTASDSPSYEPIGNSCVPEFLRAMWTALLTQPMAGKVKDGQKQLLKVDEEGVFRLEPPGDESSEIHAMINSGHGTHADEYKHYAGITIAKTLTLWLRKQHPTPDVEGLLPGIKKLQESGKPAKEIPLGEVKEHTRLNDSKNSCRAEIANLYLQNFHTVTTHEENNKMGATNLAVVATGLFQQDLILSPASVNAQYFANDIAARLIEAAQA